MDHQMRTGHVELLRRFLIEEPSDRPDLLAELGEEEVGAALASSPELAFSLVADQRAQERLRAAGFRPEQFADALGAGIDGAVVGFGAGRLDEFGSAAARLVLASSMRWGGARADWLVPGLSADRRAAALSAAKSGSLGPFLELQPSDVLRLLLEPSASAFSAGRAKWLSRAIADAVRAALVKLSGASRPGSNVMVRLCAVHAARVMGDAAFVERDELLGAAGLDSAAYAAIVEQLASGSGIAALTARGSRPPDIAALLRSPEFQRAAAWLGCRFDADAIALAATIEQELPSVSDPWVRFLYEESLGGENADAVLVAIRGLGTRRSVRSACLEAADAAGILGNPRSQEVLSQQCGRLATGSLAVRAFQAIFAVRRDTLPVSALPPELLRWYRACEAAFIADEGAIRSMQDPAGILDALIGVPGLVSPVADLVASRAKDAVRHAREAASAEGREWLLDLVQRCSSLTHDPATWDGGHGILIESDLGDLRRLMQSMEAQPASRWYAAELSPSSLFRLRRAARAVGMVNDEQFRQEVDRLVAAVTRSIAVEADERAELARIASRCRGYLLAIPGAAEVRSATLDAFACSDARDLLRAEDFQDLLLPHTDVPTAVLSPLATSAWGGAAACALLLVGIAFLGGVPVPAEQNVRGEEPPVAVPPRCWTAPSSALPVGRGGVVFEVELADLRRLLPDSVIPADGGLTRSQAREFLDRFREAMYAFPEGIRLSAAGPRMPPAAIAVRLPRGIDETRDSASEPDRTWTERAVSQPASPGSGDRRRLSLVVELSGAG
jgi:hypothetical protein